MSSKEVVVSHGMFKHTIENLERQTGNRLRKWSLYFPVDGEPFVRFRFWKEAKLVPGHIDMPISEVGLLQDGDCITFRHNYTGRGMGVDDG